jgi:hypothetical protein
MGIASYPTILIILLSAAFMPWFDAASRAASAAAPGCGSACADRADACAGGVSLLEVDASLGRWLQVAASASTDILCRPTSTANVAARLRVLGMRAGFQHDAAGFATSFNVDLPRMGDSVLHDLFRF